ncbi:putative reverse transcriptase domain-containing protein [Tanacetum coccineum]
MFTDYDYEISYHPGKANVVVHALSRKERVKPKRVRALSMTIQSGVKEKLLAAQIDRLTKSAHFLAVQEDYSMEKLSRLYIDEIVARHGVHVSIISDRDGQFTSQFDGKSESTIQTLEDMLRACVIDFGGSWDTHLPLAEFSYNNSYYSSIRRAPLKHYMEGSETTDKVVIIKERLKAARDL